MVAVLRMTSKSALYFAETEGHNPSCCKRKLLAHRWHASCTLSRCTPPGSTLEIRLGGRFSKEKDTQ